MTRHLSPVTALRIVDCDLLFVYGTLRRGFNRHKFLEAARAQFVAKGAVQAELYDLGEFPGAVPSKRVSARVRGEVYRLPNPQRALKVLDEVEAFGPVSPATSLFRRALAEVTLENGTAVRAWAYWLNRWHGPRRRIASGEYAENRQPRIVNSKLPTNGDGFKELPFTIHHSLFPHD